MEIDHTRLPANATPNLGAFAIGVAMARVMHTSQVFQLSKSDHRQPLGPIQNVQCQLSLRTTILQPTSSPRIQIEYLLPSWVPKAIASTIKIITSLHSCEVDLRAPRVVPDSGIALMSTVGPGYLP